MIIVLLAIAQLAFPKAPQLQDYNALKSLNKSLQPGLAIREYGFLPPYNLMVIAYDINNNTYLGAYQWALVLKVFSIV
jgi:hypothetical protein